MDFRDGLETHRKAASIKGRKRLVVRLTDIMWKKLMPLYSIRSRLLGLVLATVGPFIGLIAVGLWSEWQSVQATASQRAIDDAQLFAAEVDDHLGNLENLLVGLSRAVSTNPSDAALNDALLHGVKNELPDVISNILLFSVEGTNIGSTLPAEYGRNYAGDRSFFRQAMAGNRLTISEVLRARATGEWVVVASRPVEDQAGKVRAVLAIGTRLEHFQTALSTDRLPPGSVMRIVDEKGIVVAQSVDGAKWIGRDISESEYVAQHIALKQASDIVLWPDSVERITGSVTVRKAPWLVSVGVPTHIAFASVASQIRWNVIFIGGALVSAFLIAWILSGRVARPLTQLSEDASMLAAGKLSHRTSVHLRGEVGLLADNFNQMAASLERRHDEARHAANEERQAKDTLAAVVDASPIAIVCSDTNRSIVLWSRGAVEMFGYSAEETLGQPTKIVPTQGAEESGVLFRRALNGETLRNVELKRLHKNGSLIRVSAAASPMYDANGAVRAIAWAYEDVTDQKKAQEQLQRVAHYDQLTGLPNRLSLQKELGRLLAGDTRGRPTSVVLFDLDGFKDVNDTLGHTIGDELLIEVGHRLVEISHRDGQEIRVFRLGGDEFVAIMPGCGDPRQISAAVDSISKRLAEPFKLAEQTLHLGCSVGIAIAPNDGSAVDELIANADLALYRAKADGGRTHRFFLPVLRAHAQARRDLGRELLRAFDENEFEIYYQAQIRLADEAVVGAEALLRWRHPVRGVLAPGAFIDTLVQSSIVPELSKWIIRTACERTSAWISIGLPLGRIGVNMFPTQLHSETLFNDIEEVLTETRLDPRVLELEITENVALNYEYATLPLQRLHEKGVKLAFDDFGTGYASLSSLTRFPLSRIKIDRGFIAKIAHNAEDATIVRSLIAMAHTLGLQVIAEGVETTAQAAFLRKERCEEAQGFLFARPLPAMEFESYLRKMMRVPSSMEARQSRSA